MAKGDKKSVKGTSSDDAASSVWVCRACEQENEVGDDLCCACEEPRPALQSSGGMVHQISML